MLQADGDQSTQERLQLVLDSTRLGLWDWNPQTNEVLFDNHWAEMLGMRLDELTMTLDDWSSRVHPDDIAACMEDIERHIRGETDFYENLHRMRHKDGRWLYILDRGRVVKRDDQGRAIRFTGTHSDLTPLKEAEFQASVAVRSKDRFISSVSHELRAPLHAILGIVDHLLTQEIDDERAQLLQTVHDSGEFLTWLINDLLDSAKLHSSALSVRNRRFDLLATLSHLDKLFAFRFEQKGLKLSVVIDDSIPAGSRCMLMADTNRLNQVLVNLLSNALKFTSQGGATLALKVRHTDYALEVTDTGVGIEDVDAIFSPFYSTDVVECEDGPNSTGLGLGISRDLCEAMGFVMEVESGLGKGSTFRVVLPADRIKLIGKNTRSPKNAPQFTPPSFCDRTILVVDDEPTSRKVLALQLSHTGATVLQAKDGREALTLLRREPVDCLITDLHMPAMGGLGLIDALGKLNLTEPPVVVVASADAHEHIWPKLQAAGATAYLEKPFTAPDMFSVIEPLLNTPPSQ